MAEQIKFEKPEVSVDGSVAKATLGEDQFLEHCPVEKKVVKQVFDYIGNYTEATSEFAAELAGETMKKNKDVETFEMTSPFGVAKRDEVKTVVKRAVTYHMDKTKDPITKPAISQTIKSGAFKNKAAMRRHIESLKDTLE